MPPKRPYRKKAGYALKRKYGRKATKAAVTLQSVIRKAIIQNNKKMIETKSAVFTSPDGTEITHNNFVTLTNHLLKTTQGVKDPLDTNTECRIGDKITLKGVSLRMMIEMNERYSDVTYRLFVVKCAKGDVPTRGTLFIGLSGNKMIDYVNKERFTILASKTFKITARNNGVSDASGSTTQVGTTVPPTYAGIYYGSGAAGPTNQVSRATKIIKLWIDGKKFSRNGIIQYQNGVDQVKFFDYHVVLYAYSNYSTDQDIFNVGRVNDYIQQIYYTDS